MTFFQMLFSILVAIAAMYLIFRLVAMFRTYLEYRGKRLVVCPENEKVVAVEVAAGKAAAQSFAGIPNIRLHECTRWPEKQNCGQDCLSQIEANPKSCLVWNVVDNWYAGKKCALCGKPFGHINWHDHRPALADADKKTVQWNEVPPEKLPEFFQSHQPVCWNCHVAESFRREHPDMVTDRPSH